MATVILRPNGDLNIAAAGDLGRTSYGSGSFAYQISAALVSPQHPASAISYGSPAILLQQSTGFATSGSVDISLSDYTLDPRDYIKTFKLWVLEGWVTSWGNDDGYLQARVLDSSGVPFIPYGTGCPGPPYYTTGSGTGMITSRWCSSSMELKPGALTTTSINGLKLRVDGSFAHGNPVPQTLTIWDVYVEMTTERIPRMRMVI